MVIEIRGPIGSHETATSEDSWDGPANERRLRDDENASYYRQAYAWEDSDEDGTAKAHFTFIHHEVSSDGSVGAANVQACTTGIGVLNGGRGGTNIPSEDRQGVYNHLARHLRDADVEPPDLRTSETDARPGYECRAFSVNRVHVERRQIEGGEGEEELRLSGHAAVFDEETDIAGLFTEVIRPGAFRRALSERQDVALLLNHDPSTVMARTGNGSLQLIEDNTGLYFEARLDPRDSDAQRTVAKVERANISQMSFAFQVDDDGQRWDLNTEPPTREINDVDGLWDISPVTYPAYSATDVHARGRIVQPPAQHGSADASRQRVRRARRNLLAQDIARRRTA